jgi:hypothetical protein
MESTPATKASPTPWIHFDERRPTEADLPILLWNFAVPKMKYTATPDALRSQLGLTCFSAWMPAPPPPVPHLLHAKLVQIKAELHGAYVLALQAKHESREEVGDAIECIQAALAWRNPT